jgi:hypothetical protein
MILIKSLEKQIVPGNVIEVDTFGDPADMDIRQPMVKKQVVRARLFRDRWGRDVSIGCTKEVLADLQIIFDTIDDQARFISNLNNELNQSHLQIDRFKKYLASAENVINSMNFWRRLVYLFCTKPFSKAISDACRE